MSYFSISIIWEKNITKLKKKYNVDCTKLIIQHEIALDPLRKDEFKADSLTWKKKEKNENLKYKEANRQDVFLQNRTSVTDFITIGQNPAPST